VGCRLRAACRRAARGEILERGGYLGVQVGAVPARPLDRAPHRLHHLRAAADGGVRRVLQGVAFAAEYVARIRDHGGGRGVLRVRARLLSSFAQ